jgi:hypothetical protein
MELAAISVLRVAKLDAVIMSGKRPFGAQAEALRLR